MWHLFTIAWTNCDGWGVAFAGHNVKIEVHNYHTTLVVKSSQTSIFLWTLSISEREARHAIPIPWVASCLTPTTAAPPRSSWPRPCSCTLTITLPWPRSSPTPSTSSHSPRRRLRARARACQARCRLQPLVRRGAGPGARRQRACDAPGF
jgi:hypothetical protein